MKSAVFPEGVTVTRYVIPSPYPLGSFLGIWILLVRVIYQFEKEDQFQKTSILDLSFLEKN